MNAVDTNVLIYACDGRDPVKQQRAIDLLRSMSPGITLWQVGVEFLAAARRLESQGFNPADAWERLAELMVRFPLVAPSSSALPIAKSLHLDQRVSFWDAMVLASCLDAGVDVFYSEDMPGTIIPGIQIVNPFT